MHRVKKDNARQSDSRHMWDCKRMAFQLLVLRPVVQQLEAMAACVMHQFAHPDLFFMFSDLAGDN